MKRNILVAAISSMALIATLNSCKKKDTVVLLPVVTATDSIIVNFSTTAPYTFYSFKNKAIVANTDSNSTKWDFAMRRTTFLVNSNASGPGQGGAILRDGLFTDVTAAPATGYAYDTTATQFAIKDGSWYDYNPVTRGFVPKAGKVFIFRTADGKYAKMELTLAEYMPFIGMFPTQLKYKFRFTYQPNGTLNF